jgi:transposase-like protein
MFDPLFRWFTLINYFGVKTMGQILHGSATTTHVTRTKIQNSNQSQHALAELYNVNVKTIAKWQDRQDVLDRPCGKKKGDGSVLTDLDEKVIVQVRCLTLLPLDDLYDVLKPQIKALSRSNLHRCLQRNNVSRLTDLLPKEEVEEYKAFKTYAAGFIHIDTAQIIIEGKKWYVFVAIDRATRYAYIEVHADKTMKTSEEFLKAVVAHYPCKIHRILTDNGAEFSYNLLPEDKKPKEKVHLFDAVCQAHDIQHRTTKFKHPWTNGLVEAMNKKIKANTTKKYHYDTIDELKKHMSEYLLLYNFSIKLRSLKRLTPFEAMLEEYQDKPDGFIFHPNHLNMGSNIYTLEHHLMVM